jgi:hypothetical protein
MAASKQAMEPSGVPATDVAPAAGTAHIVILGEGEYDVPLGATTPTLGELLGAVGIADRAGTLYLNGSPALPSTPVTPDSEAIVLPTIRGG